MEVKTISWEEAIPIRHRILWPHEDASYCNVEGDDKAWHFGVLIAGEIHCAASLYIEDKSARLKKFATLQQSQGVGLGRFMLNYLLAKLKASDLTFFGLTLDNRR